jgi:hypothetical protein
VNRAFKYDDYLYKDTSTKPKGNMLGRMNKIVLSSNLNNY